MSFDGIRLWTDRTSGDKLDQEPVLWPCLIHELFSNKDLTICSGVLESVWKQSSFYQSSLCRPSSLTTYVCFINLNFFIKFVVKRWMSTDFHYYYILSGIWLQYKKKRRDTTGLHGGLSTRIILRSPLLNPLDFDNGVRRLTEPSGLNGQNSPKQVSLKN